MYIHVYRCTDGRMNGWACMCAYACMYVCTYVCMYVCICVCCLYVICLTAYIKLEPHIYIDRYIHTYIQGAGNFAELCSETARGISSTCAQNSRITVGFFKRLARNRETRKECSQTTVIVLPLVRLRPHHVGPLREGCRCALKETIWGCRSSGLRA